MPTTGLPLSAGTRLQLHTEPDGWRLDLESENSADAVAVASRWLVEQLDNGTETALDNGFQLHRFSPIGSPAPGSMFSRGSGPRATVLDERLLVSWPEQLSDGPHPVLRTSAHLRLVGYTGCTLPLGALSWRSPGDRDLPCAFVSSPLTGAVSGREWATQAVETGDRPGFPAEVGRAVAVLHLALATGSPMLALPVKAVGAGRIRDWHGNARRCLEELTERIPELDALVGLASAAETSVTAATEEPTDDGDLPVRSPSAILADQLAPMRSVIDRLLEVPGRTPIQLVHADLDIDCLLSGPDNRLTIDLGPSPVLGWTVTQYGPADQPAARDVARLLLSLDQIARAVDRRAGHTRTAELTAWSNTAREQLLTSYRARLALVERNDVLDLRLLAAFLVEQFCRDLLSALSAPTKASRSERVQDTLAGLETLLADLPAPEPARPEPPATGLFTSDLFKPNQASGRSR